MRSFFREIENYINQEIDILKNLDIEKINEIMNILEDYRISEKRIFICGNGGSAATASHFVCDFNKGISLNQKKKYKFECLNDNVPTMMAIANDISYDKIFEIPLRNKMTSQDLLIGISGSGNSKNVLNAFDYANSIGAKTIALVGYDGGALKKKADYCIHVNINNMQIVEDIHMILNHIIMYILSSYSIMKN